MDDKIWCQADIGHIYLWSYLVILTELKLTRWDLSAFSYDRLIGFIVKNYLTEQTK